MAPKPCCAEVGTLRGVSSGSTRWNWQALKYCLRQDSNGYQHWAANVHRRISQPDTVYTCIAVRRDRHGLHTGYPAAIVVHAERVRRAFRRGVSATAGVYVVRISGRLTVNERGGYGKTKVSTVAVSLVACRRLAWAVLASFVRKSRERYTKERRNSSVLCARIRNMVYTGSAAAYCG